MKLSVFPSSIETSRALILRLVEIMNEEPDRVFNIAVSGGNTPALIIGWMNVVCLPMIRTVITE